MNLESIIRQITNQQEFVDICNTIFTAIYKEDFQIIDGTRADAGNDGYIISEQRIFSIHCPSKPENRRDKDYLGKIYSDLEKAKKLNGAGKLKVSNWTFVTPGRLSNEIIISLRKQCEKFGFKGNHIEATFLANELYKHPYLLKKFPALRISELEDKIEEIHEFIKLKGPSKEKVELPKESPVSKLGSGITKESEDLRKVLAILRNEQVEGSKAELRSILYRTTDKVAQVNAITGLLHWWTPLDDKPEDLITLCDLGIKVAENLKIKWFRAFCLAHKGYYLSFIWSQEDMSMAFTIQVDNTIGIQTITGQQKQETIARLRSLADRFNDCFKEALIIAQELNNAEVMGQVLMNIGNAAGERFIHLNHFGIKERADYEKDLAKRSLLFAKELYSVAGNELSMGYALNNLANQLNLFGEKKEALSLSETAIAIAEKYKDSSLLQTATWLKESIITGKIPNYAHGERRERKK